MNEVACTVHEGADMTELILVRHGRPESGDTDPPLNEEGASAGRAPSRVAPGRRETHPGVVCSDLRPRRGRRPRPSPR